MQNWKRLFVIVLIVPLFVLLVSCDNVEETKNPKETKTPTINPTESETEDGPLGDLHIMTYNMRFENINKPDPVYPWRTRVYGAVESFEKYNAHVVGTQELERWQHNMLLKELGSKWDAFGESRDGKNGENSAIYYRSDLIEVLDSNTIWLSETPDKPNSKSWGAAHPRVLTYGKFRVIESGFEFLVFNTHLDHKSAEARRKGLEMIVDLFVDYEGIPTFVTGDFNMNITDEDFDALTGNENFIESFSKFAEKFDPNGATFHGFDGRVVGRPIDFVFYTPSDFELVSTDIIYDKFEDRFYLSDHYPVLSIFNILEKGE